MPLMENLRRYREKAGYKQAKDFADIVGIKYPNYMAYENKGAWPSQENLIKIAAALHVSIDELLGYEGTPTDWIKSKLKPALENTIYRINAVTDNEVTISCDFLAYDNNGTPISNDRETFTIAELHKIFDETIKSVDHAYNEYIGKILNEKLGRLFLLRFVASKK